MLYFIFLFLIPFGLNISASDQIDYSRTDTDMIAVSPRTDTDTITGQGGNCHRSPLTVNEKDERLEVLYPPIIPGGPLYSRTFPMEGEAPNRSVYARTGRIDKYEPRNQ